MYLVFGGDTSSITYRCQEFIKALTKYLEFVADGGGPPPSATTCPTPPPVVGEEEEAKRTLECGRRFDSSPVIGRLPQIQDTGTDSRFSTRLPTRLPTRGLSKTLVDSTFKLL